jgi:hypothetical protein
VNYFEFQKKFTTELSIINYFIKLRYKNGIVCPKYGAVSNVYHQHSRSKTAHCNNSKSEFSVFANTIFEKSDTDLRKWFYAINLVLISCKGISAITRSWSYV